MDPHAHHWRATQKVFGVVCECGVTHHDWALAEIERLKAAAPTPSTEEIAALREQLAVASAEIAALSAELTAAKRALASALAPPAPESAAPPAS